MGPSGSRSRLGHHKAGEHLAGRPIGRSPLFILALLGDLLEKVNVAPVGGHTVSATGRAASATPPLNTTALARGRARGPTPIAADMRAEEPGLHARARRARAEAPLSVHGGVCWDRPQKAGPFPDKALGALISYKKFVGERKIHQ